MSSTSLSRNEIERAKFTFSIYDFEGVDKIDATQLGHALRAMGLFPTLRRISNLGGTKTRNEKLLTVDEFLAIYQEAKQDKVEATGEDYVEILSGYDKDHTGKISVTTLSHLLQGYGEDKLDKYELEEVINDCAPPDYDDYIDYRDFIHNLMKGPDLRVSPTLLIQQARAGLGPDANPTEADETLENRQGKKEDIMQKKKDDEKAAPRKRESVSSIQNESIDEVKEKGISRRTRESVKSNAENEDQSISSDVSSVAEKSAGGRKLSRRDSAKPGGEKKAGLDDVNCAQDAAPGEKPRKRSSVKSVMDNNEVTPEETPRKRSSVKSVADNNDAPPEEAPRKRSSVKSVAENNDALPEEKPRKRSSVKSGVDNNDAPPEEKSNRKSITGKRDSTKSNPSGGKGQEEREASPDDGTCASEMSEGKSIPRTRDSQKSDKLDRGASPGDISWASEAPSGAETPKSRNSLKAKETNGHGKISPDISGASEATTTEDASKARSSLKSAGGSKSSSKSKKSDSKKKEEEVKAKFQQPLISLKTEGLFGGAKKKE